MKLNSTIALTLILLTSMLAAGLVSAAFGLTLGREALKGVTQPDTRPTNTLGNRKSGAPKRNELVILREDDIINTVKARIDSTGKTSKTDESSDPEKDKDKNEQDKNEKPAPEQADSSEAPSSVQ